MATEAQYNYLSDKEERILGLLAGAMDWVIVDHYDARDVHRLIAHGWITDRYLGGSKRALCLTPAGWKILQGNGGH